MSILDINEISSIFQVLNIQPVLDVKEHSVVKLFIMMLIFDIIQTILGAVFPALNLAG